MLNWHMQNHGADMLRLALSTGVEAWLMICAPIFDAFLLEGPIDEIDAQAEILSKIIGDAWELVMGSVKRCQSDIKKQSILTALKMQQGGIKYLRSYYSCFTRSKPSRWQSDVRHRTNGRRK